MTLQTATLTKKGVGDLHVGNAMWAWNPYSDQVCVVPWPDVHDRARQYSRTGGACYLSVRMMNTEEQTRNVLTDALRLIVAYQCDPRAVNEAFFAIREYREAFAVGVW